MGSRKREATAATVAPKQARLGDSTHEESTTSARVMVGARRNARRAGRPVDPGADRAAPRRGTPSVRQAWIDWLSPHFADTAAAYFTGTYSDDYGLPHGLMLCRNVHKDVRRFLRDQDLNAHAFICGVEQHQYRDVLHWHGIIAGPFTDLQRQLLKANWEAERGYARVLPVLDGCASYVTKYALKGDTDSFDWNLT